MINQELTQPIIDAAFEVHKCLGPGLLESAYEQCLAHELANRNISFCTQVSLPVRYKKIMLDCGYRIDLFVQDQVIVELKSVDTLTRLHEAQILTYMKIANIHVGLLLNFNCALLRNGIKRFVL
ncbi:GxxExxY protein [bacterium]|nr:GxxExxY protein [bacterium]